MEVLMRQFNRILALVMVLSLGIFSSCEDDEGGDNFNKIEMLKNVGENIILPAIQDFEAATVDLNTSSAAFSQDPSAANLNNLREKLETVALKWMQVEMFNFGPVEDDAITFSIHNWPTNTLAIEGALITDSDINNAYIENLGSSSKGIPAIEYLVYGNDETEEGLITNFNDNIKRLDYLRALCENLNVKANEVNDIWTTEVGGKYIDIFTQSGGSDINSSTNILANSLIFLVEKIKNNKIGIPLGKKGLGDPSPKSSEAWRSSTSLTLIKESLVSVRNVFTGTSNKGNLLGYDDYLNQLNIAPSGTLLSEEILAEIEAAINTANAINPPLKSAVVEDQESVELLYSSMQKLAVLMKVDMMSGLGLVVTFSDNDGD